MPQVALPVIPSEITVHLGTPNSNAENVTLPFAEYIKNVASSEIYPTWPESAIRANIYAQISFALNRIYNEWYPSQGYDFDITNSTAFDQSFVKDRDIFLNISEIVDEIFNDYLVRQGTISPLFAQYCDGVQTTCNGLSQWGTVTLANQGLSPYQILTNYYGNDINIVNDAPVEFIDESYPGEPLALGSAGNDVKILQSQLNRVARNYPAIPRIPEENGVYGLETQEAVRTFQQIFNLPQTGEVDRATWYKIKRYYIGVKRLSDLLSEGVTIDEATLPYSLTLASGQRGQAVRILQYYLSVIAYFNPNLNTVAIDGVFGQDTENAVRAFQEYYGLPATGVVERSTWDKIDEVYINTVRDIPPSIYGGRAKIYPGYFLIEGSRGEAVTDLQSYLSLIGQYYRDIPQIPVTGYFGSQTENAVREFQRRFGIRETGAVGPLTWATIAEQYNFILDTENI